MSIEWTYSHQGINWDELSNLYKMAPLGDKSAEDSEKAFSNSMFKCFLLKHGTLVGAGRALADGIDCSYLCDIAVHPSYQGLGLGRRIVAKLVELSRGHKKIILYANPGKEPFYKKQGFKRMSTAMAIFTNQSQALAQGLINES